MRRITTGGRRRRRLLTMGVAALILVSGLAATAGSAAARPGAADGSLAGALGAVASPPVLQALLQADPGAAGDHFGLSVAVSGDTALVGAPYADPAGLASAGLAYVYTREGETWGLQQTLAADAAAVDDRFGAAVALSGDTALVGAPYDDTPIGDNSGSVWVFVRVAGVWRAQQQFLPSTGAYEYFGEAVSLSGGTAVVGSAQDDTVAEDAGAAYVFTRSGETWKRQTLTASDGVAGAGFGWSVAASGETVLVGAPADRGAGSAYAFTRSSGGWVQSKLTAADGVAGDRFGHAVALSGNTAVVGALYDSTIAGASAGSAYLFTRSEGRWVQRQQLTAGDGAANDQFGRTVAVSGDLALVGVPGDSTAGGDYAGSAWLFKRTGDTWVRQTQLVSGEPAAGDRFATSVALQGSTAVIGSSSDDTLAGTDAGSAAVLVVGPPLRPATKSPKGTVRTRRPVFKWKPTASALRYEVRVFKRGKVLLKKTDCTRLLWKSGRALPRRVPLTWKVRAFNAMGAGPWSAPARFRAR